MTTVLTATDGSVDGQNAVRWAVDLAASLNAEVVIATAWRPDVAEVSPNEHEDLRADAQRRLEDEWCAYARSTHASHRSLVLEGDPRDAVLAAADEIDADLVVIGARGMGGRQHALHLGSVAHHLVHHTERPLATIPASARTRWPTTIVIGVDGSAPAAGALAWVTALPPSVTSDVVATYAEAPPAEWVPHDDPKSWYQQATKDLEGWVEGFASAAGPVRRAVVDHTPATGLAEVANREHAGVIVVGARGVARVAGARLGSTALKVLHHAHLPVVVVP